MDIPVSWVRERLGIPAPIDGEDTLKAPPAPPAPQKTQVLAGLAAEVGLPANDPPDPQSLLTDHLSRTAAPVGEVTTPMRRGSMGRGFLWASSKRPSPCSLALSRSKAS